VSLANIAKCQDTHAYGLLSLLELAYALWQRIFIDFIVDLPKLNEHTQICVIVDRFTKMAHLISLKDDAKWSKDLAKIFVSNIWHLHGLPTDIVSDLDRIFTHFRQKYAISSTYPEEC
jgi:hypothetical protein